MKTKTQHTKELNCFLRSCQQRITKQLKNYLPPVTKSPNYLHHAMRYAVLHGGKRLRPLFVYATGKALNITQAALDPIAVAVELTHCYSLVHDDLPAMDNDEWRRGQPSCHKAFDEATAILAGNALQALAFHCLPHIKMVSVLSKASGSVGMIGGQALDLVADTNTINLNNLKQIHYLKTGALIEASIELSLIAANCQDAYLKKTLKQFARCIGLAFQIQDDILDTEGQQKNLGKTVGLDITNNKATYTRLLGLSEAKRKLEQQYKIAMSLLEKLPIENTNLKQLCQYIVKRDT